MYYAINVLKNRRGYSYEALIKMMGELPFRVKNEIKHYFYGGDVFEVDSLIEIID